MDYKISLGLGAGLLGLAAWTALGRGPSAPLYSAEEIAASVPTPLVSDSSDNVEEEAPPADLPPQGRPGRGADDGSFPPHGRGGQFGLLQQGGPGGRPQYSEDELDQARGQALAFWVKHSPERYKEIQSLPEKSKKRVEDVVTGLYLNWQRLSDKEPELYKVIVDRVELEDKAFKISNDIKQQNADPKASKPLRDIAMQLVENNFKERQIRLNELSGTLEKQREILKQDQDPSRRDGLVSEQVDSVMKQRPMYPNRRGNNRAKQADGNPAGDPTPPKD